MTPEAPRDPTSTAPSPAGKNDNVLEWVNAGLMGVATALLCLVAQPTSPNYREQQTLQAWGVPAPAVFAQRRLDFAKEEASADVRRLGDWVVSRNDHRGLPFVLIDKPRAHVFAFDGTGRLLGSAPALLGSARGDDSVPGIGERRIADILPSERITPAGRFVGRPGRNAAGEDIVWVDYQAAVSMHRVRTTNPRERRAQRLASPGIDDNRISYGCINLPPAFYDAVISPMFSRGRAMVYLVPDTRSLAEVFGLPPEPAPTRLAQARTNDGPGRP